MPRDAQVIDLSDAEEVTGKEDREAAKPKGHIRLDAAVGQDVLEEVRYGFDAVRKEELAISEVDNVSMHRAIKESFTATFMVGETVAYQTMAGVIFAIRTLRLCASQQGLEMPVLAYDEYLRHLNAIRISINSGMESPAQLQQRFPDHEIHAVLEQFDNQAARHGAAIIFLINADFIAPVETLKK